MLLVLTKKWIKTLWLLLWDVNDNQVNTKRIKLIGTLTIQVRLICENRYFCLFVGDLLISVSPKHPTVSKAKITFFYCSSNISSSNSLPLSLQTSICSLQEMKESLQLHALPWLVDISKYKTILWRAALKGCHTTERAFCGKCQNQNNKCLFCAPNSFLSALNSFFKTLYITSFIFHLVTLDLRVRL